MTINGKLYREVRCKACHKLICFEYVFAGRLAFACPRCGEINEQDFKHLKNRNVEDSMREYVINNENGEEVNKI